MPRHSSFHPSPVHLRVKYEDVPSSNNTNNSIMHQGGRRHEHRLCINMNTSGSLNSGPEWVVYHLSTDPDKKHHSHTYTYFEGCVHSMIYIAMTRNGTEVLAYYYMHDTCWHTWYCLSLSACLYVVYAICHTCSTHSLVSRRQTAAAAAVAPPVLDGTPPPYV